MFLKILCGKIIKVIEINLIRQCLSNLKFTTHAKEEMLYEEYGIIHRNEITEALINGEVIERYAEDKPYPSVLIYGRTFADRPLHIACAPIAEEKILAIITVYQPDPKLWIDYKIRREVK